MKSHHKPWDILIVGAGLFGATCAYELARKGYRCLVLEKRCHIGGNCYTRVQDGMSIHAFGPHIFHTSNKTIWQWINQFAEFNHYRHHIKVNFQGKVYSFPPNLNTFNELWGTKSPTEAKECLDRVKLPLKETENLENWALSNLGREIYEIFIRGYTQKQWHRSPLSLPASIIKRIPMRFTYDDNYFDDPYQGIPVGGYTPIFEQLLSGVEVRLETDYLQHQHDFDAMAARTLYTGPIDSFFDHRFGSLEYLSAQFVHEKLEIPDFQGVAQMNYTSSAVPYTRIIEHKHFSFGKQLMTWITKEYPIAPSSECENPMYPIRNEANLAMLKRYQCLSQKPEYRRYYFGGRLAEYRYYDMHQIIGAAWKRVDEIEQDLGRPSAPYSALERHPRMTSVSTLTVDTHT